MTLKISEMISQRLDLANVLVAGIDTSLDEVGSGFDDYFAPVLAEGEEPFDARRQLVLIRRKVVGRRETLVALNADVVAQIHDKSKVRVDVDDLADVVVDKLRSVRHTCRGLFGPDGVARSGLRGRFPERPLRVHERAELVQTSLRNPDLGLKPRLKVVATNGDGEEEKGLTPADLAEELEPEVTLLGEALKARYAENREEMSARSLRRRGIEDFDKEIRALVSIVRGIFQLAGREDLAERFSTALRRYTRRSKKDETEPAPAPEAEPFDSPSEAEPPDSVETAQETASA